MIFKSETHIDDVAHLPSVGQIQRDQHGLVVRLDTGGSGVKCILRSRHEQINKQHGRYA